MKSFPVGEWQTISAFTGDVYVSSKSDSTFISDEMKERYPDTEVQRKLIQISRDVYLSQRFIFREDGTYLLINFDKKLIEERYKLNRAKSVIETFSKNAAGEYITDEIKYRQKGKFLYLIMDSEDNPSELMLEKLKIVKPKSVAKKKIK